MANKFANGALLSSDLFGGGEETNDFLQKMGFTVLRESVGLQSKQLKGKNPEGNRRKKIQHDERCKDCKETVRLMLEKIYGRVKVNYDVEVGAFPEDYQTSQFYASLLQIFKVLQNHRGYKDFVRTIKLPRVDYFVPNPGFIVEFDESQHFTTCRKIALMNYPENLQLGFDKKKWMEICDKTNTHDNTPVYRDEQRAWYDALRDFLPTIKPLFPTKRLYSKSFKWCSLEPDNTVDTRRFIEMLEIL